MTQQDQKILEMLINSNQRKTKAIVSNYLKKHYSKIIETNEYVFAEGDIPIALVAHMDTVFEDSIFRYGRELFYDEKKNVMFSPHGAGFDDKAGIFAIIQIIRSGYHPHIIFTTDEEKGAVGAAKLAKLDCPFPGVKYFIQLDRRGSNDCVFYDCDNLEFIDYVEKFGFEYNYGSFTDISELCPAWGVAGVNLSVGYRDEHSESEVLFVGQLLSTIKKVKRMLEVAEQAPVFKYIPMVSKASWYGWGKGIGDIAKCHHCKKYFLEDEMFPTIMIDKSTEFYCADCIVDHVAWCNSCGNTFQKYSPEAPGTGVCPICIELEEKAANDKSTRSKK